jgi:hypothetical protein
MMRYLAGCLSLLLLAPCAPATAQENVDLELILMADGLGSVDDNEFILQRMGHVQALRHPTILRAIRGGRRGRIALSYVEWSGDDLHVPIVPWTVIHARQDIEAFAAKLETHPRELYGGGTALGDAILYGMQSLKTNRFDAPRLVIDLSGDEPDRNGLDAVVGRDKAVAARVAINGLPILDGWPGLDRFFYDNVIGGPGAFVESARGFKDVYYAVRRKMIREISALPPPAKTPTKISAQIAKQINTKQINRGKQP